MQYSTALFQIPTTIFKETGRIRTLIKVRAGKKILNLKPRVNDYLLSNGRRLSMNNNYMKSI